MKKLKSIFTIAVILAIAITSCKKSKEVTEFSTNHFSSNNIKNKVNDFLPQDESYGKVYNSFLKQLKESTFKETPPDVALDTLLWQTETYLNNEYGFSRDSIFKSGKEYDTVFLSIRGYTGTGIPIVDGQDAIDLVSALETEIISENSDGNVEYFWCTISEVDSIFSDSVSVVFTSILGNDYSGVYPPGWDPTEFLGYTCMKAGGAGYCNNEWWWGANLEYESRYEMGGIHHQPNYIYVLNSFFVVFPSSNINNGRLWVGTYSLNYILDTDDEDELNQYLLSTKDLIDDCNPMGSNNLYLGNVDIYAAGYEPPPYNIFARHYLVNWYFKKIYVEPIID